MKCKFGIVSIMLAGLALTATAQTKEKYYSEKFKDNIFISAGVGAQACVNPDNFDYGFGHAITPCITCLTLFADIIRSAYLLYLCSQVPD